MQIEALKITRERIVQDAIRFPDLNSQVYALASSVIEEFLGWHWRRHFLGTDANDPFFRMDKLECEADVTIARTVSLGEMLLNLQDVEGFEDCLKRLKSGTRPDDTYCEFEVGKLLRMRGRPFRFVESSGSLGNDYDIEMFWPDGKTVPVETKCKLDSTTLSTKTVRDTLERARTQLPKSGKGFIFLKVPQGWVLEGRTFKTDALEMLEACAEGLLARTSRVVSVKIYSHYILQKPPFVGSGYVVHEVPSCKDPLQENWPIFEKATISSISPTWLDFFHFTEGQMIPMESPKTT
jgi:hypothetical protein